MSENNISVSTETVEAAPRFVDLGLSPQLLEVLQKNNYITPTPIQHASIPVGMNGEDIIGIAQTGTGKTLAFGLPIIDRFIRNGNRSRGRALVVLPTRELALQVEEAFQKVGRPFGLRSVVLIGGTPMRPQINDLRRNPDVIICTPGRIIDHVQQRNVDLRTVDTLVLDEADRMLDMGFMPQIKQILREVPEERQTMLYSATMPDQIVDIASNYMHKPTRVEIARAGTTADQVTQELFIVPQDEKNEVLSKILYDYTGSILIFARTRSRARRVAKTLRNWDHSSAEIHSDRTLPQRKAALEGFKNGTYRVLVATDIAARGIDVTGIELVINYDLPDSPEDYVHRIGRTGRAGKTGHAISLVAPDQAADLRDIEKLIRSEILVSPHSTHDLVALPQRSSSSRGSGNRRPSSGSHSGAPQSRRPVESNSAGAAPRSRSAAPAVDRAPRYNSSPAQEGGASSRYGSSERSGMGAPRPLRRTGRVSRGGSSR